MPVLPLDSKPASYYEQPRLDLVEALPQPYGRVLDIGCGGGVVGRELLRRGAEAVVGIELDPHAAEAAKDRGYEDVLVGDAERLVEGLDDAFDTVLCHDILEHLFRPDAVLRTAGCVARPGATLSTSVPNARYFRLLYDLIFRGTFGYQLEGHRDSTHVRWLTRKDLVALVEESGWRVEQVRWPSSSRSRLLKYVGPLAREFGAYAWHLQARLP